MEDKRKAVNLKLVGMEGPDLYLFLGVVITRVPFYSQIGLSLDNALY